MPNLNKVILMGNLTADPVLRTTPGKGTSVTDISLAINRFMNSDSGDRQTETTYVDVTLWGRQAEIATQYLKKGSPAFIEGRLQLDTWEDRQSGQKRSKLKVVGENLQLLSSREGGQPTNSGNYNNGNTGAPRSNNGGSPPPRNNARPAPVDDNFDDDIPF